MFYNRCPSYNSCLDKSEKYNNRKYHNHFIQTSISLQDVTNDKEDFLLNNFIISIVYISEDSLPHIILCENIQWTLKLFKKKVIQKLYSINQKLQNEMYNEFQNLKKRYDKAFFSNLCSLYEILIMDIIENLNFQRKNLFKT